MPRYERTDVHVGVLWSAAAALAVIVALAAAGTYIMSRLYDAPRYPQPLASAPDVALSTDLRLALERYRSRQETKLRTFGWVDRDAGVARIPVDRAIDMLVERAEPSESAAAGEADDEAP